LSKKFFLAEKGRFLILLYQGVCRIWEKSFVCVKL